MGEIAFIVPVRGRDPKTRLASILDAGQRRRLLISMLEDVLETLRKSRRIRDTFVVSSDQELLDFARRYGANSIQEERNMGVNSAVETAFVRTPGYSARVVIPADLPFIKVSDIRNAIALHRFGASIVISPSEKLDGTNLLLLKDGLPFSLRYDSDSYRSHIKAAMEARIPTSVYYSETVAFDIDTAGDIHRAFKLGVRRNTMTFLARVLKAEERKREGLRTEPALRERKQED